ncbi:site-specific integrase [Pseudozobellia sp. WGM2]|uniref:site-specific integrase n=1 Tax=Pseudozobellia sp. WGM2 TaxID=2787625 RepID=UPI001AE097B2|nr:site-specific integrase [Pseudozobellia sp. WGM2]
MKTTNTFSIHFWLKRKAERKDGKSPIYVRITVNGQRAELSLQEYVRTECWCSKTGRVTLRAQGAQKINDNLSQVHSDLVECKKGLKREGIYITAQLIKSRYLGVDKPLSTLVELIKYHKERELKKLEKGTAKNYSATEKYLQQFIKTRYKTTDVNLGQINYGFIMSFEDYLRTCKPLMKSQPLNNNGIMKHMERFKKMTTIAYKLDCIKQDPFAFYNAKFTPYDRQYLSIEELKIIEKVQFKDTGLAKVQDCFIFACYTGLSYIDLKRLRPEQIVVGIDGGEWIYTKREKSKTAVKIPLLSKAKEILYKYANDRYGRNNDLLLPVYSNQKCNSYLKKIIGKCGIDKHISFHAARHTFATTVTLANGVPLETVSKLLGHRRLSTTQIYARVMEKKISEDIAVLKTRLESSTRKDNRLEIKIA